MTAPHPVADREAVPKPVETRKPEREADYRAAVQNDPLLSRSATATATALIHRYFSTMELYASQETIAKVAKYAPSSRKAVRRDLAELVALGYLEHVGTKPNRIEHYRFTIPVDADTTLPKPPPALTVVKDDPAESDPWGYSAPEPIVHRPALKPERRVFGEKPATAAPFPDDEPPS